jgi:hypothetical protein
MCLLRLLSVHPVASTSGWKLLQDTFATRAAIDSSTTVPDGNHRPGIVVVVLHEVGLPGTQVGVTALLSEVDDQVVDLVTGHGDGSVFVVRV